MFLKNNNKKNYFKKNLKGYARGYILLITALIFISVFSLIFFNSSFNKYTFNNNRLIAINDFINNLNKDLERMGYISGFRALISLEDEVSRTGVYLNNTEKAFKELFVNGTLNGIPFEIMKNATIIDYLESTNTQSKKVGIILNLTLLNVSLYQNNPWNVIIDYNIGVKIKDINPNNKVSWSYIKNFKESIPIIDFKDPLFIVETKGTVLRTIKPYSPDYFINDINDLNDTSNLQKMYNNSFYVASPYAPDYLMRLEGNFSSSKNGIESFIDLKDLESQGLIVSSSYSIIDYQYFNKSMAEVCKVQNMPLDFKIRNDHYDFYELYKVDTDSC